MKSFLKDFFFISLPFAIVYLLIFYGVALR
jgi:hypothetical protein